MRPVMIALSVMAGVVALGPAGRRRRMPTHTEAGSIRSTWFTSSKSGASQALHAAAEAATDGRLTPPRTITRPGSTGISSACSATPTTAPTTCASTASRRSESRSLGS
jgi:hypothetical protein